MNAAHPSAIRLGIVNRSSRHRQVSVSPWGEEIALESRSEITVGQAVAEVGYFEIEVADMGVFVHAWPTTAVDIVTADRGVSLDPQAIAPQTTAGRATGWPGDSKEFARRWADGTVAGFFITDSRPSAKKLQVTVVDSSDDYSVGEMIWITAVSDKDAPTLEIHDDYLAVVASHVDVESGMPRATE